LAVICPHAVKHRPVNEKIVNATWKLTNT